nr:cation diffusion facilitator family transporter [Tepidanaerobacter syntrophicus]
MKILYVLILTFTGGIPPVNKKVKSINNYLIALFLKENDFPLRVTDPQLRKKYAYLEAWVSIVGNLVLAAIKIFFGLTLNSISLMADAIHTASDVLTSIVVLLGFKFSSSPADEKHPYGHGRIESLATLLIAAMLIVVGVQFGQTSWSRFIANTPVKGSFMVAGVMVVGAIFKEWMAQFSVDLGMRTNASALMADAMHHRTDGIASILVAIAIIASRYGYYRVDAIFGLGVSALIIYTGINIIAESASRLIGEAPDEEILKVIEKCALSIPGVCSIHKVNVHDYGDYKEISLHIQVEKDMPLIKAHEISEQVERAIEAETDSNVTVHIEPLRS